MTLGNSNSIFGYKIENTIPKGLFWIPDTIPNIDLYVVGALSA